MKKKKSSLLSSSAKRKGRSIQGKEEIYEGKEMKPTTNEREREGERETVCERERERERGFCGFFICVWLIGKL